MLRNVQTDLVCTVESPTVIIGSTQKGDELHCVATDIACTSRTSEIQNKIQGNNQLVVISQESWTKTARE